MAASAATGDDSLWDIPLEELGQIRVVSIASGSATPLDKAAAITSVISSEDIAAMGANDLDQVLETVPGLHVNHSDQAFTSKYIFRGITSSFNPQALVLINGVPVTTMMFGNRGNTWGGMPVKAIKRIEVIRGPGSALYGADAYAGVINIITKSAQDIEGVLTGVRAGSFDRTGAWVEAATDFGGTDVSLVLEQQSTDGWRRTIERDAQTNFDEAFGTSASLAPGPVNTSVDQFDARLDARGERWQLRAGIQDRRDLGTGPGLAQALDPEGRYSSQRLNVDYSYRWEDVVEGLEVESRVSYLNVTQEPENDIALYPPGAFGGAFPDGFLGSPGYKERQLRVDLSSIYSNIDNHRILSGVGAFWADLYDVTERKNFNTDFSPKGQVEDVSNDPDQVWMPEEDRKNYYVFVQDEWQFAQNWQLVSGLRYDYYADFGQTINPRAALVWATTDTLTTKFLYGRAFRAPSLNELYAANNPITAGNEDLNPETIDTLEVALAYQATTRLFYGVNVFYYEIDDLISAEPIPGPISNQYQNSGKRKGHGAEVEASYQALDNLNLTANYAYQTAEDQRTDSSVGQAPNHQAYARIEWGVVPTWDLNTQVNWVGEQKRAPSDPREPVDDYTTVDFVARTNGLWRGFDIAVSVRNAFNADVRDPSPYSDPRPEIPGDFPMPGRSAFVEAQYQF
ncbi:TonB-dependent receptor plug domain-containing protein [Marinobacter arenosus]|uniref:TonB-dependent receptor plug domain-containing protein n=1 Tax=Marinobacter arenosus TaxID=2856822 RepID=UPI001C4AD8D9|nr:TonB-dependent receptor [Marinobacter arenosus]MBW0147870.1 TonB-dependent receptor [Marinobacter arenosus]